MPAPTNGELLERTRNAEAELAEVAERGRLRIAELEGLLAGQTRQLEACQREAAELRDELDNLPTVELAEAEWPAHLVAIDQAIARLAGLLRDDVTDHDDLWLSTDAGEPRLAAIATAVASLSSARDRLTPRPLPAIR